MHGHPPFLFESHEDEVYHSLSVPSIGTNLKSVEAETVTGETARRPTNPEFYAFLNQPWVFNTRMRWQEAPNDTLLCYCEGGPLPLTGREAVSRWFSDPKNRLAQHEDGTLCFDHGSERTCDAAVLPGLQFSVEQHPVWHLKMLRADADWQCCVYIKGRSGPPFLATDWQQGAGGVSLDLAGHLRKLGYRLHFAELHFAVGLCAENRASRKGLRFRSELGAAPAVTPCLPVIRTVDQSASKGVPVSAVVTDEKGRRPDRESVRVTASVGSSKIPLQESDGYWHGWIPRLPQGDHEVRITVAGALEVETRLSSRITDGRFMAYAPEFNLLRRGEQLLGPLNGSYQGLAYFRDVGTPDEAMVQGQEAYEAWDRSAPAGEHWHYWEALTERELDERFGYLAANGWDLAHISQHWGLWEKFDAGGHIAPHGAEQAAAYYRVAARHGLQVVQALAHYPYGLDSKHTMPFQSYLDNGYTDGDWLKIDSRFTGLFHAYLRDYARLFQAETAIAFLTASGEGDIATGPARVNDMMRCIRAEDANHLFLSEPIHSMQIPPEEHVARWAPNDWIVDRWTSLDVELDTRERWAQPLFGSRLYGIGRAIEPELDLGIECKWVRTAPVFIAEGSWPCPEYHCRFGAYDRTWCGKPEYRTRVRDSLYLGLLYRIPMILTWEEQLTEDEHRIFSRIRSLIDWRREPAPPHVCIQVDSSCVQTRRDLLGRIEKHLSRHALQAAYLTAGHEPPPGTLVNMDAREGGAFLPEWVATGAVPDVLLEAAALRVSPGYRTFVDVSADGRQGMAYLCNSTHHERIDYLRVFGGTRHRLPRPTNLEIEIRKTPPVPLRLTIFDLNRKAVCHEVLVDKPCRIDLGKTEVDYFLLAR